MANYYNLLIYPIALIALSADLKADPYEVFCSRSYYNQVDKKQVHRRASSPCCNGTPTWNDCHNQGGTPVPVVSSACAFHAKDSPFGSKALLQGSIWACKKPAPRAKLNQSLEFILSQPSEDLQKNSAACVKTTSTSPLASQPALPSASAITAALTHASHLQQTTRSVTPPTPVAVSQNSGTDPKFQAAALHFQATIPGIFAKGSDGIFKTNHSHSNYPWYIDLVPAPGHEAEAVSNFETILDLAEKNGSTLQLGMDGYSSKLLGRLQNCSDDAPPATSSCKNLLIWKKMIAKHPGLTVYFRPFAEMNLGPEVITSQANEKQFADTWNQLGKILKGGSHPLTNMDMIFSPMANAQTNSPESTRSLSEIPLVLKQINPQYIDAFGMNVYSRVRGAVPPTASGIMGPNAYIPTFIETVQPWQKIFKDANASWGTSKPVVVTEAALSRLPFNQSVVAHNHPGPDLSEESNLKFQLPQMIAAIHASQKDPKRVSTLVATWKANLTAHGETAGIPYLEMIVRTLTPGDPLYNYWDQKRAQWVNDAYAYAKKSGFPMMVYFKEDGTDWDADPDSKTMAAVRKNAELFKTQ